MCSVWRCGSVCSVEMWECVVCGDVGVCIVWRCGSVEMCCCLL